MAGSGSWRPKYDSRRQKGGHGAYSPSKMSFSEHRRRGPSVYFAANWVLIGVVGALAMLLIGLTALIRGNWEGFLFALVAAFICYKLFFHKRS